MTNVIKNLTKYATIAGLVYTGVLWNPEKREKEGKESFLESKIENVVSKVSNEDFDLSNKGRKAIKYSSIGLLLGLGATGIYNYNKRMMQPIRYQIGFGELGREGFRKRYPTTYLVKWEQDWRFGYRWHFEDILGSSFGCKIEKKIKSLGDGKYIIYDEWDTHEEYPKEDSFLKNEKEYLVKAKPGMKTKFCKNGNVIHFN
jgi:hypothetical protein